MLDETVRRVQLGDSAPRAVPPDVSLDVPAYIPDEFIASQEAKLDVYRRLTTVREPAEIDAIRDELRDRFGAIPAPVSNLLATATLRVVGADLGIEGILVHGEEARITFRDTAAPRMKGLSAAFHEVQFRADVRRAHPLSLKLTRLGGSGIVEGLVRALQRLRANP
jgi:transcription-repair coupling factor (superfamily II helicase)